MPLRSPQNVCANVTPYLKHNTDLLGKKMPNNITYLHLSPSNVYSGRTWFDHQATKCRSAPWRCCEFRPQASDRAKARGQTQPDHRLALITSNNRPDSIRGLDSSVHITHTSAGFAHRFLQAPITRPTDPLQLTNVPALSTDQLQRVLVCAVLLSVSPLDEPPNFDRVEKLNENANSSPAILNQITDFHLNFIFGCIVYGHFFLPTLII